MDRLRSTGVRVFIIKGNHDAQNPITGALDLPDNVHVFDERGGKVEMAPDITDARRQLCRAPCPGKPAAAL